MMKKAKKLLNEKLQVKTPESLSTENIMANIENSKAEIIEMPKKKNTAKRLVPIVASLLLVVGIVGMYMNLNQKKEPSVNNSDVAEVMRYQSYDKVYAKFDALHKEAKKNNIYNTFSDILYGVDEDGAAGDMAADGAIPESSIEGEIGNVQVQDDTATGSNSSTSANKNYGTTNTQEKDVDEGDIIKTDGNYLYIADSDSNTIRIIDVTGDKMSAISEITLDETNHISEIYINGDKLVIIGNLREKNEENKLAETSDYAYGTYGCYVEFAYDTFVKVYNISDRSTPKLATEFSQQGAYDNSRMIGARLYTISEYNVNVYSDDYRDECIPTVTVNDVCKEIPADGISIIEESRSSTYAVLTTLEINETSAPESEAILGECNHLYATSKSLFLAETTGDELQTVTKIYKFDYTDTGVEYKCTGKVNGYINDQFSISYDGEYFRIATTADNVETDGKTVSFSIENRTNNLYILNNQMQIAGKVEGLAKGESIKSARFIGNMAYVVTFRQTDPLFVIDLSDPENPTVKGELKIPGFSEYLHPITKNLIVGVGQDGTETGTNGDCKVSLFDVNNPYEPKETVSLPVSGGKGYVWTGVSFNHKLYVTLSDTEFAVPFYLDWYVNSGELQKGGVFYIRYKLENGTLCEVNRYDLDIAHGDVLGGTYVEDTFYAVAYNNDKRGMEIIAFDLTTNEEISRIKTYEK